MRGEEEAPSRAESFANQTDRERERERERELREFSVAYLIKNDDDEERSNELIQTSDTSVPLRKT